jgi:ribonuclease VapC
LIAIDTSALIAVLFAESAADEFERRIAIESACMSAVTLLEASMVLAGRRPDRGAAAWQRLDELVRALSIEVVAHDRELVEISRLAFLRFGKGRHPARLNFGDCASYALARKRSLPLLFKGTGFAKTDIVPALPTPA